MSDFFVKFWGTVGGMAGGNFDRPVGRVCYDTPCVEVFFNGTSYLLDAGSGFTRFCSAGKPKNPVGGVFFSHYHLDHICGLWLLGDGLWDKSFGRMRLVGPRIAGQTVDDVLHALMREPISPGPITWAKVKEELSPDITVVMHTGSVWYDGVCTATFVPVVHGAGESYSIRLSFKGGPTVVYATDVDFGASKEKLVELCQGADFLIADCEYTNREYYNRTSPRPHSGPEVVVQVAEAAGVKHLTLFHHPYRTDSEDRKMMERLSEAARFARTFDFRVDLARDKGILVL
ncbi:MAG: MBL fold metallo-hydrolase [Candidatus Doudnabacteria bacterium]|nr:MBL fold metallo-hydrolase [Candidatus Doudnabacteria bacterium]